MISKLRQPLSFSEIGKKDNQEDYVWPLPSSATPEQRIFVLCDGVGGQEKGEVASQTAATALGESLTKNWPQKGEMTKEIFQKALDQAYRALDMADSGTDSDRRMGTTMTCIVFHTNGVLVAHIGDSRIYHLRPSLATPEAYTHGILHQTSDHSLVNELLKVGEITEEEAANYPRKNVITRAMQPHQKRPCKADICNLTDIEAGDYFFLCSDGVLEQVSNERLVEILADTALDDDAKLAAIKTLCDGQTRDNYTCWLIGVESVEEGEDLLSIPLVENDVEEEEEVEEVEEEEYELPDEDIEDVKEEVQDANITQELETAEEDVETENNIDLFTTGNEDEEDFTESGFKSFCHRTMAFLRQPGHKIWNRIEPSYQKAKQRIQTTKLYKKLSAISLWNWIIYTIIFLAIYDVTLFFFGDKSYEIIYPKAEPLDSVLIEEKPKLTAPEVEEYEPKKPSIESDSEDKKGGKEIKETVELPAIEEEEYVPTSVNTEDIATPITPSAPKIEKPIVAPTPPPAVSAGE